MPNPGLHLSSDGLCAKLFAYAFAEQMNTQNIFFLAMCAVWLRHSISDIKLLNVDLGRITQCSLRPKALGTYIPDFFLEPSVISS